MQILNLAMPIPLRRSFDYLPPADCDDDAVRELLPGIRVLVPFGSQKLVGLLLSVGQSSTIDVSQLRAAEKILDQEPVISPKLMSLSLWASNYYHHPIGDCLANALPTLLRKGENAGPQTESHWQLTTAGKGLPEGALKRAQKQAKALSMLQSQESLPQADLLESGISRSILKALADKGLVECVELEQDTTPTTLDNGSDILNETPLSLNPEQQLALDSIKPQLESNTFRCFLLEGITGSGKTEVYLQLLERCLALGRQALILVPEIGLTPQTLQRFEQRFSVPVISLHSGLNDRERALGWQQARNGQAKIIIGTRSAIFTPLPFPGLIVVDEEHDLSFKQQDGFRYHARDIAIKRASDEGIPIVLGSATPSIESLQNAESGRYQHLKLMQRAGNAQPPRFQMVDIRHQQLNEGISAQLLDAARHEISSGNQVLIFINRRGFAPTVMCHDCGWLAECSHCDARMTLHHRQRRLRCHHCDRQRPLPPECPQCQSKALEFRGPGTERCEQILCEHFPDTPVLRIDRDSTQRKHALRDIMTTINSGNPCIMVGTQMLAKGHHFPDVTLVGILDIDGGLFSADFRGGERAGQLLMQVSGRAGRASKPGRVLIQTHHPDHPLILTLTQQGFHTYAKQLLSERKLLQQPPFSYFALLRADAKNLDMAEQFLRDFRRQLPATNNDVTVIGPLPSPMTRRAGRFRAQLLLQASERKNLHYLLKNTCQWAEKHPLQSRLHWSIDVDPQDMF